MGNMLWLIPCVVVGVALTFIVDLRFESGILEKDFLLVYYSLFTGVVLGVIAFAWFVTSTNSGLQTKVGNYLLGVGVVLLVPYLGGGVHYAIAATKNAAIQTRAEIVLPNDASGTYAVLVDSFVTPSPDTKDQIWTYRIPADGALRVPRGYLTSEQEFASQHGPSLPRWLRLHQRLENGRPLSFLQCQCSWLDDEAFRRIGIVCHVHQPGYTIEELGTGKGINGSDMARIREIALAKPVQPDRLEVRVGR
jgi:hypothetical protein